GQLQARLQLHQAEISASRGLKEEAERSLEEALAAVVAETDLQFRRGVDLSRAWFALAAGRPEEAYQVAVGRAHQDPFGHFAVLQTAGHAALWLGRGDALLEVRGMLETGRRRGRAIRAMLATLEAGLAGTEGEIERAVAGFSEAADHWRELGLTFDLALTQAELARLIGSEHPAGRAAAEEAEQIFTELGAQAFLDLLRASPRVTAPSS
ncbi:MAG: hypothetical protein ACRDXD_10335, partial [Acidimicrobiia bacterium]